MLYVGHSIYNYLSVKMILLDAQICCQYHGMLVGCVLRPIDIEVI